MFIDGIDKKMDYSKVISVAVSESSPCGENLEDDNLFCNFLLSSEGTQERSRGDVIIPASPPDWRQVRKEALAFIKSTKDLRLVSVLTQSVLNLEGAVSFASCLEGIATLLEDQWDSVYPLIDHEAETSAEKVMERISALSLLTHDRFVLDSLRDTPLVQNKVTGPITLRIILACTNTAGDVQPEFDQVQISSIFRDDNQEKLNILLESLVSCQNYLNRIQTRFSRFDAHVGVDFISLNKILQAMISSIEKYGNISHSRENEVIVPIFAQGENIAEQYGSLNLDSNTISVDTNKVITSREDVEKVIDKICEYYKKYEPSSPIPILLLRAKKLVHLEFIEILKNMAPESLESIYKIGGISEDLEDNDN